MISTLMGMMLKTNRMLNNMNSKNKQKTMIKKMKILKIIVVRIIKKLMNKEVMKLAINKQ